MVPIGKRENETVLLASMGHTLHAGLCFIFMYLLQISDEAVSAYLVFVYFSERSLFLL